MSTNVSSTERLTRLLALVPWLSAHAGVSIAAAAEHFGVSEQALIKDLDLLICTGPGQFHGELLDIDYDEGSITVLDALTLTRPLRLTGQEAAALSIGLRVLADTLPAQSQEALDRVRATIEGAATAALPAGSIQWESTEQPDESIVLAVQTALDQRRAVTIDYASANADALSTRTVDPIRLMWIDGHPYLIGWCRSAMARRTFRVDRIAAITVLDESARPPEQFDGVPADLIEPTGSTVTVVLAPHASTAFEEYPVESVAHLPDGQVRVAIAVSDLRWIVRVLLRLGDGIVSVSPREIAEVVAAQAVAAVDNYT